MCETRNSRLWGKITVLLIICCCLPAQAKYGGGSGTPADPYLIYDANHMQAIGADAHDWDKHFKLKADIDLGQFDGKEGRERFNIIGTGDPFWGVFDGNDHTISNFTYDSNDRDDVGLFRLISGPNAGIKNLGLIDPNVDVGTGHNVGSLVGCLNKGTITNCYVESGSVTGDRWVGGLVGENIGTITKSYSTASVSGDESVGGLVGHNRRTITYCYSTGSVSAADRIVGGLVGKSSHIINNCYSTGSVSGDEYVSGLVGWNAGLVTNCYSTGSVSGNENLGGLVGYSYKRIVSSFWDIETSGQLSSTGGSGRTTAQMQTASTYLGWNGCGEIIWTIDEGNDYPRFLWEDRPGQPLPEHQLGDFLQGSGSEIDPYLVYTDEQLNMIGLFLCEWDKYFELMADIDLSAFTGTSFNIIGIDWGHFFAGVFDGNGHTVSNFSYTSTGTYNIGLFGLVNGPDAEIKNLGLIDPNVDAGSSGAFAGSLAAQVGTGTIANCYVQGGYVRGNQSVGGLVGSIGEGGDITDCYSNASVSGEAYVGGLLGRNYGPVTNCYSTGSVSGEFCVGGLVGTHFVNTIINCYSKSDVSGTMYVGGLVGVNGRGVWDVVITNCYAKGSVEGETQVGGLVGRNSDTITNSYSTGTVVGDANVGGLVGENGYSTSSNCYVGVITNSYWDIETSGEPNMCGSQLYCSSGCDPNYGKITAEMQTNSTFTDAGWDFVNIWDICEGTNYPKFIWQIPVGDFLCPDGVNYIDFSFFAGHWAEDNCGASNDCEGTDLDRLGTVDINDLGIFVDNWMRGF